jgi:hypothetical protein
MFKLITIVCICILYADYSYSQSRADITYLRNLVTYKEYSILNKESEALLFTYPESPFLLKINMFARSELGLTVNIDHNSTLYYESLIYQYDSGIKKNMYSIHEITAQVSNVPPEFRLLFKNRIVFDSIINAYYDDDILNKYSIDYNNSYSQLYNNYRNLLHDKSKTILFSLFPGGGYCYNDEYTDGSVSLMSTLIFASISIFSWYNGNKPAAALSGSVAGIFYFGSILGSYNQTQRKNEAVKQNVSIEMTRHFNFEQDRVSLLNEK